MPGCTEMERYLFGLNGFPVLKKALTDDEIAGCGAILDELQDTGLGEWRGHVHGHNFTGSHEGLDLQQIYEAGEPFEKLIDHPSWIDKVLHI